MAQYDVGWRAIANDVLGWYHHGCLSCRAYSTVLFHLPCVLCSLDALVLPMLLFFSLCFGFLVLSLLWLTFNDSERKMSFEEVKPWYSSICRRLGSRGG